MSFGWRWVRYIFVSCLRKKFRWINLYIIFTLFKRSLSSVPPLLHSTQPTLAFPTLSLPTKHHNSNTFQNHAPRPSRFSPRHHLSPPPLPHQPPQLLPRPRRRSHPPHLHPAHHHHAFPSLLSRLPLTHKPHNHTLARPRHPRRCSLRRPRSTIFFDYDEGESYGGRGV